MPAYLHTHICWADAFLWLLLLWPRLILASRILCHYHTSYSLLLLCSPNSPPSASFTSFADPHLPPDAGFLLSAGLDLLLGEVGACRGLPLLT